MDPKTNKRRGFVFITFKEEEPVKKVVEKKYHNVSGTKDTSGKEGLVSVTSVLECTDQISRVVVRYLTLCHLFNYYILVVVIYADVLLWFQSLFFFSVWD